MFYAMIINFLHLLMSFTPFSPLCSLLPSSPLRTLICARKKRTLEDPNKESKQFTPPKI